MLHACEGGKALFKAASVVTGCVLCQVFPRWNNSMLNLETKTTVVSHYTKPCCCFRSYCFAHFPKFEETSWLLKPWHRLKVLPAHGIYSLTRLWGGGGELGISSGANLHIPMLPSSDNIWGYRTFGCISILSNLIPGKKYWKTLMFVLCDKSS